ncbi:hypothetical protein I0C86_39565 [Plantactinospora sp. S1510]|uniref:Uncharacterized protein n=1 Tax=Plantactinospora alkalitolerans TaxID=2789879 RepID=A0ABS0HA01_9ACTN|nr:hypothetical protein [Plantactinospora alkalitolerans]MBF9134979.1 hypothetical protein [Plantactinospora alkalitolerans]
MTAVRGLLLFVIVGVLAMVGAVLANWIPRPAAVRTRWALAGLAGVVLASAVLGLLTGDRHEALGRVPLTDWVADVNKICVAVDPRAEDARKRGEDANNSQSQPERLAALRDLRAAHSDLHKEVSALPLPSDPNDRDTAKDWLDVYGVRLDRLTDFVKLMEGSPQDAFAIGQAAQLYAEATTTARRKSEALKISCA